MTSNLRRLLHSYMRPEAAVGPAEVAFGELRAWRHVASLAELRRRQPRCLLEVRCAVDGNVLAVVWPTHAHGPLLVTDHDYRRDDEDNRDLLAATKRHRDAGTPIGSTWAPRLGLVDAIGDSGDPGDLLPLVCRRHGPRPLGWPQLRAETTAARRNGRRVAKT